MKRILLLLFLTVFITAVYAQDDIGQLPEKKQENIEALKVAFISKELELTPEEAQRFWPVYNQYSKELKTTFLNGNDNVLDRDEKVLNLRKRYRDEFTKVLGGQRVNKMFIAEGRFRQVLINTMRNQKQRQLNRPLTRRGI